MLAALSRRRRLAGFTLIELLIVILIIGILIAIAVPAYLRYTAAANDRDAQSALRTAYKAAVAGDTEVNSSRFPVATSVVNDVKADEPAANVARGDCYASILTAPANRVLVDPASSSAQLTLCDRSASGAIWRLSGPLTGTPSMTDGATVQLTLAADDITDTSRAAASDGDGLTNDSSTGIWESTWNVLTNASFESGLTGWQQINPPASAASSTWAKFGSGSASMTYTGSNSSIYEDVAAAPGDIWSTSAWVNVVSGSTEIWLEYLDSSKTVLGAWNAVSTGTGPQLLAVPDETAPANTAYVRTIPIYMNAVYNGVAYTDGAQTEKKSVATPFTLTARNQGRVQAPAELLNATQGWVAMRVRMGFSSATMPGHGFESFFSWADGPSNRLDLILRESDGKLEVSSDNNGSGYFAAPGAAPTFNAGDTMTVIAAWTSTQHKTSVNGTAFATGTGRIAANIPKIAAPTFDIGNGGNWSQTFALDGSVIWFACGTGTLTDADASTINGWTSTDPKVSAFPAAAQADFVWGAGSAIGSMR